MQVEETRAVSAGPTQEFTKFRFWSSCLGDDLNVTRCPSSCFMKTLCLESTLHIMLSRPIWPCIRKKGWTAGILSMLQLIRSNHGLQWLKAAGIVICCRKTQISDGWTRQAEREWHQSQHLWFLSIQIFLAWCFRRSFRQHLYRRQLLVSFARTFCSKGFGFWILQHPICSSPHSAPI